MDENQVSKIVIGAAIEVHRVLGPGLLEGIYEDALELELKAQGLRAKRQVGVTASYKSHTLPTVLRLDILVAGLVIVEVKSIERLLPVHEAQLLSYFV